MDDYSQCPEYERRGAGEQSSTRLRAWDRIGHLVLQRMVDGEHHEYNPQR